MGEDQSAPICERHPFAKLSNDAPIIHTIEILTSIVSIISVKINPLLKPPNDVLNN